MNIKREDSLKSLAERFAIFANVVTTQNRAGFNDINKSAERLFIDILNVAYNLRTTRTPTCPHSKTTSFK
ncbi:hypothetical protein [Vibrio sp. HB161653]|uniref:hypothetical protein n=1 Tax=Vibrio sp. HB161653 TaxID=3068274 RepID=UPI0035311B90